jgi:hypothetical protein
MKNVLFMLIYFNMILKFIYAIFILNYMLQYFKAGKRKPESLSQNGYGNISLIKE